MSVTFTRPIGSVAVLAHGEKSVRFAHRDRALRAAIEILQSVDAGSPNVKIEGESVPLGSGEAIGLAGDLLSAVQGRYAMADK